MTPRPEEERSTSFGGSSAHPNTPRSTRPWRSRWIVLVACLIVLVAAAVVLRPSLERWMNGGPQLPVSGRLLLPTDSGLVIYSFNERNIAPLVPTAAGEIVSAAAWSPDSRLVAYSFFHRRPGDPANVSEVYLVGADGSEPRPLAERDRPGAILDGPAWSTDGKTVFFSYFGQVSGRAVRRIERVSSTGGERATVVEDGYAPAISPDGQSLAFLRDERTGTGLWLGSLAGTTPTALVPPGRYGTLAAPRFSPDGRKVAASIVNLSSSHLEDRSWGAWLLPRIAFAHGDPWDIWTFDVQSGEAKRVTQINADEPAPAWSPDGRYIAFWGGGGLHLVASEGGEVRQVLDKGGYGSIDWVP